MAASPIASSKPRSHAMAQHTMMKDLLRIASLNSADLQLLLDQAQAQRLIRTWTSTCWWATLWRCASASPPPAPAWPSRRGHPPGRHAADIGIGPAELQRSRGEPIADTARDLSRYVRAIVVCTLADADLLEVATAASVPVVNALSDSHDPCQILAGLLTCTSGGVPWLAAKSLRGQWRQCGA
jgi:ornithine carbamoyltransferase